MLKKSLGLIALVSSLSVSADLVDNGNYTTDTATGLGWLDLTETTDLSYDYISSQFGSGGEFEGYRYANESDINTFFANAGALGPFNGNSSDNQAGLTTLFDLWGETQSYPTSQNAYFLTADLLDPESVWHGTIQLSDANGSYINTHYISQALDYPHFQIGSALIKPTALPVPASAWLFGSALMGLVGINRKKKQ